MAIYAALQEVGPHDCTIATDSLASMFSINRALRDDPCHNESPHAVLLIEIAKLILHRSQLNLRTAIIKVKSHTGIQGIEMADQLANAARQPDHCQLSISLGSHAFNNQMWPQILNAAAILKQEGNLPGTRRTIYTPANPGCFKTCKGPHYTRTVPLILDRGETRASPQQLLILAQQWCPVPEQGEPLEGQVGPTMEQKHSSQAEDVIHARPS